MKNQINGWVLVYETKSGKYHASYGVHHISDLTISLTDDDYELVAFLKIEITTGMEESRRILFKTAFAMGIKTIHGLEKEMASFQKMQAKE